MYIVFEGIDGTGKTTQLKRVKKRLTKYFSKNKYNAKIVSIAEQELQEVPDDDLEEALQFVLQRVQLHKSVRKNYGHALSTFDKNIVLSDRSYYSSLAYQGLSLRLEFIESINSLIKEPSLIFLFEKGEVTDWKLEQVRKNYYNVLPLRTIIVDTKNHNVNQTTKFITNKIIKTWETIFKD